MNDQTISELPAGYRIERERDEEGFFRYTGVTPQCEYLEDLNLDRDVVIEACHAHSQANHA